MKKLMLLLIMGMFLVSFASAFDWNDGTLISYWDMDETSGIITDSLGINNESSSSGKTPNQVGLINNAVDLSGTTSYVYMDGTYPSGTDPVTMSTWVKLDTAANDKYILSYGSGGTDDMLGLYTSGGTFNLNYGNANIDSGITATLGTWFHLVAIDTGSQLMLYVDGVSKVNLTKTMSKGSGQMTLGNFPGATSASMDGLLDEVGVWNTTLTQENITELYNSGLGLPFMGHGANYLYVNLDFPPEGELLSDVGANFTANYTYAGYNLTNATYYVWKKDGAVYDLFNATTTTNITANTTTQFIDSFTLGDYKWNVYACGENLTDTYCNWATANYTFEIGASIDSEIYDATVFETEQTTFTINISLLPSVILYQADLIYNNTSYTGTVTDIGSDKYSMTVAVYAPEVGAVTNIPFYWSFKYDDDGTSTQQNITSKNQSVLMLTDISVTSGACGAGFFSSVYYSFADSENLTALNADVAYNFKFGISSLNEKVVKGSINNTASFRICINESIGTYKLGYGEMDYTKTAYSDRRYYMYEGQTLSNVTQANHTLHLLPSTESTSFIFEFKNTFLNPYTNKLVALFRWYPDADEYKIVEMSKTDETGKTVMKVHTEDVDYRVGLYDLDGNLLRLADPVRMACLVDPCTYSLKVVHDAVDFSVLHDLEESLTWDETNKRFVFVWNDPSQATASMRLYVYKDLGFQEQLICNDTASGYTGVLTCVIGNETGQFYARAYRTASPEMAISTLIQSIRTGIESSFGLFASFLIALAAALIGAFSPVGAIVLLMIGLVPAVIFGSITMAIFFAIGTLGGVIIHVMKNYG